MDKKNHDYKMSAAVSFSVTVVSGVTCLCMYKYSAFYLLIIIAMSSVIHFLRRDEEVEFFIKNKYIKIILFVITSIITVSVFFISREGKVEQIKVPISFFGRCEQFPSWWYLYEKPWTDAAVINTYNYQQFYTYCESISYHVESAPMPTKIIKSTSSIPDGGPKEEKRDGAVSENKTDNGQQQIKKSGLVMINQDGVLRKSAYRESDHIVNVDVNDKFIILDSFGEKGWYKVKHERTGKVGYIEQLLFKF